VATIIQAVSPVSIFGAGDGAAGIAAVEAAAGAGAAASSAMITGGVRNAATARNKTITTTFSKIADLIILSSLLMTV
jgi:hypothetical protein